MLALCGSSPSRGPLLGVFKVASRARATTVVGFARVTRKQYSVGDTERVPVEENLIVVELTAENRSSGSNTERKAGRPLARPLTMVHPKFSAILTTLSQPETDRMSQLTRGQKHRLMYIENKEGDIDGAQARIGWVEFSRSGRSIYYRGRELARIKGGGVSSNYMDIETGDEYWVSGVKKNGQDAHWAKRVEVKVDDDALADYSQMFKRKT